MNKSIQKKTDPGARPSPRGRRTLILVVSLFLLPVVLATGLYVSGWRPDGRSLAHGELVQPARPVSNAMLEGLDGTSFQFSALRGKWALVYFVPPSCTQACQDSLYKMQQVRLTQGRDAPRVERVLISENAGRDALRELAHRYPGVLAVSGTPASLQSLAREFVSRQGTAIDVPGRVYLIDPIGNLVLSYAPDADPSGMRKDLARLLRLSQVG